MKGSELGLCDLCGSWAPQCASGCPNAKARILENEVCHARRYMKKIYTFSRGISFRYALEYLIEFFPEAVKKCDRPARLEMKSGWSIDNAITNMLKGSDRTLFSKFVKEIDMEEKNAYKDVLEFVKKETEIAGELKFENDGYRLRYLEAHNLKMNIVVMNVLERFAPKPEAAAEE